MFSLLVELPIDEDTAPNLTESLLISILEVQELVLSTVLEQENFMQFACYLERTNPILMELNEAQRMPGDVTQILRSLSRDVDLAKALVEKCKTETHLDSETGPEQIIKQLERVVKSMGHNLSQIPSSSFQDHDYPELAVRSLSRDMRNTIFQVTKVDSKASKYGEPNSNTKEIKLEDPIELNHSNLTNKGACLERQGDDIRLIDFLSNMNLRGQANDDDGNATMRTLPQVADYIEPLYETFFCPLTKKIMEDPVTIESGQTYERSAIIEWLKEFEDDSNPPICPVTRIELKSTSFATNTSLKSTIKEWKERNEASRIKLARAALSLASSECMIIEAMKDLQNLCRKREYNKHQIRNVGMIPPIAEFLKYDDKIVRCEALDTLRILAEDDEANKEIIAQTKAIPSTVKIMSSNFPQERHAALSFLLELSKSESLCEKIGSVTGGILLLITLKYNQSTDAIAAEKADTTLRNLEKCSTNIRLMTENGLPEPLLNHLVEGSERIQMEMVSYLGDIDLENKSKEYVANRAANVLLELVNNPNSLTRKAALRALIKISSHHPNGDILIKAGILPLMAKEILTEQSDSESTNFKEESAAVLVNILESGFNFESIGVTPQGHTMVSNYVIYPIIQMLQTSKPEVNKYLIRILLCLIQSPKATNTIVSMIRETESTYTLIELIDYEHEELTIASTNLLLFLSKHMGHIIADSLCKTEGQPGKLVKILDTRRVTEKQSVTANFLASLPHENLTLSLALTHNNIFPIITHRIHEIQKGDARTSRFVNSYIEGLVGILVGFTFILKDFHVLSFVREYNLIDVFKELLTRTNSDEILIQSLVGLEKLSLETVYLSKEPQKTRRSNNIFKPKCCIISDEDIEMCPIHRGVCSSKTTFCLLEAEALEGVLACLDHENVRVVEAALSTICTLIDERVNVQRSVDILIAHNVVEHVLNVLREHRYEEARQNVFRVVERLLENGFHNIWVNDMSRDRVLISSLVTAFHHGRSNSTRVVVERILKYLNKMPSFSSQVVL
ncbi:hypothetical protein AMTRI_Chr10g6960 [Amborella trichopoda]